MFDNGIIYHIGHENGDVDVFPVLYGTEGRYLGNEVFLLPDVRYPSIIIDFSSVSIEHDRYEGFVTIDGAITRIPQLATQPDSDA